ncbi:MAG: nicotinate (nicotinamide) nucleotide adenylyltransferase [Clostridia bacterium]|nr:nicotinate (nicotinamide) nucleotide adenylyltransferase [Clostridia bacterium]
MKAKLQKVAVFGGSFDPVTNAHVEIIRNLSKKFSRVVVLPCRVSPFKQEGCSADGEDRVKMLRKVTADMENVKVSKWELKREGISYSVDAVKHYAEKYEGAAIWFVIGSDCVVGLPDWKDADYLAANATFYVVRRVGHAVPKKVSDGVKALGFTLKSANFKVPDDSSAYVRAAAALGRAGDCVPAEAAAYIEKHQLYGEYAPYAAAYKKFGLKEERIEHTLRAVKAGVRLAKIHGQDVKQTVTALLLHDIGKYADKAVLQKHKIVPENYDALLQQAPAVLHAYVSAAIARDYFGCNEHIVHAVQTHTTGSADMNTLDKIVFLADAVEDGRDYEGVESLRKLADKDLDRAMLRSLRATIKRLKAENKPVFGETTTAARHFAEVCRAAAAAKKAAPVFGAPTATEQTSKRAGAQGKTRPPAGDLKGKDGKTVATSIAQWLCDKKGRNVVVLDVAQKTVVADCFVIAGAGSTTAVKALADYVDEKMSKDHGIEPLRRDISPKWAVLDYGDVIVHIQHEEAREFYRLEKLWDNGDNITHFA